MTEKTTKPKKQEIMLRLSDETVEKIDRIIAQTQSEKPGLPVTRAGICYMLLETAIAAWEANTKPRRVKPAKATPPGPAVIDRGEALGDVREALGLDECETCRGSGMLIDDIQCPTCHGSGKSPGTAG